MEKQNFCIDKFDMSEYNVTWLIKKNLLNLEEMFKK
jgi:hypothetical protein